MRVALVAGTIIVAIVAAAATVSVVAPAEDAREFRGLAEIAARLSSATTTTSTTSTTTTTSPTTATTTTSAPTTTAPPATVAPEADPSDPGAPSAGECQAFLNEVLAAGRPPTSGETQYLWVLCGINIDDHYP
jgi:hypothetical protein